MTTNKLEDWWGSFLSLWRAILLGGRIKDPAVLTQLLLFLPPVEGLTPQDIGRILNWKNDLYFEVDGLEVPKGWAVLTELCVDEESTNSLWDFEVCTATIMSALNEQFPTWRKDWKIVKDSSENPWFIYRVLKRGQLCTIATWMEARRELMRKREFYKEVPDDIRRTNTISFLEYAVESVLDCYIHEDFDEDDAFGDLAEELKAMDGRYETAEIATWVYDYDRWDMDYYYGPDILIDAVYDACKELGYLGVQPKPKRTSKKKTPVNAATLAA